MRTYDYVGKVKHEIKRRKKKEKRRHDSRDGVVKRRLGLSDLFRAVVFVPA